MSRTFHVVAHRGCRSLYPENTLEGFRKAIKLGVDAIEFDVHPTENWSLHTTTLLNGAATAREWFMTILLRS